MHALDTDLDTNRKYSRQHPQSAIVINNLTKSYGDIPVLQGINLEVKPGKILGILGRNGAGKSTLINIMCGLLRATSGELKIWGINPTKHPVGKYIGYAPQDISVYPHLTVEQNLRSIGEIQGTAHKQSQHIMELLGLRDKTQQSAVNLSGGQKRRLHTAMALMHNPKIAFLDEPTVGADVEARNQILKTVKILASKGTTIIYTSHYLTEFEQLGADIAVLNAGKITVNDSLHNVISRYSEPTIRVFCANPRQYTLTGWKSHDDYLELDHPVTDQGAAIAQLLSTPEMADALISNIEIVRPSLENAYLNIVNKEK